MRIMQTTKPVSENHPSVSYDNNASNQRLVESLGILNKPYRATPWLFNAHTQLIFYSLRKYGFQRRNESASLYDHHEQLTMRDGGLTALYWSGYDLPETTPTIVLIHTISGSPDSMAELVNDLRRETGWRIVLCLRRGHGGLPLVTPRFNIVGCTNDFREQLAHIQQCLPDSPLYAVGTSAGSGLLVRYLGEEGRDAPFKAAFAYCPGYDTSNCFENVHPRYSRIMAKKLVRQFVSSNEKVIAPLRTANSLKKVGDLGEFYQALYEVAGYPDYSSYDQKTNPMNVFERIKTPIMVLNAEDDPICHIKNLEPWRNKMKSMDNVILVTTRKGSHCAHYEGWSARSWSARLMADYFKSVESAD
ncbi:MAG: alpha/beta hydrolase [Pelagibaca sp.]|nr:alpha/beta hydrolase [Pelagibaca sp.]